MATTMTTKTTTGKRASKATGGTCGLTLRINGERYSVRPIEARAFGARKAFRLRKLATCNVYDLAELVTGSTCDCADWTFRRDGIDPAGCKHLRAMRALGILG